MNQRLNFFLSFFCGIILSTLGLFKFGLILPVSLAPAGLIFLVAHFYFYKKQTVLLVPVAIFCLAFAFGLARAEWSRINEDRTLDQFVNRGEKVELTGLIVDEPDVREKTTRLTFQPDNQRAKVILISGRYPEYLYGERLKVFGKLEKPENFETDAGREFDYENYLAKDGIYYLINQPSLEKIGESENWLILARGQLFKFKKFFVERLGRALPEPHASLMSGIVIGAKRGLPSEWQERFRIVGLSHIIVLSGYNITIVAEAVTKIFAFLPRLLALGTGGLAILFFTLATGASSTAVRAALMAGLALFAKATGRVYQSLDALVLAAFLMVLFKPKILVYDLSFQLSFLATIGVIIGPVLWEKYFNKIPTFFGLREMAATTISAQLLVLPWILYKMGQLSLVALPINLLALTFVPFTMLFGFLTFIFAPFAHISYLFLSYDLLLAKVFASLPFASVNISYFPFWLTVLIYLSCFYFWRKLKRSKP